MAIPTEVRTVWIAKNLEGTGFILSTGMKPRCANNTQEGDKRTRENLSTFHSALTNSRLTDSALCYN